MPEKMDPSETIPDTPHPWNARATGSTGRPPAELPGYRLLQRLGTGAYGEVWVAIDSNTGRRVAIKFFASRAHADPSFLSREIEKLVFLSTDRYVVQLLEVGWEADPPYFVMDYLESGSLEDRLRRDGPLPVAQAVELFREIGIGLSHAHGKGILHCDVKPANILLDQDLHPRLADFGQSRLAAEQRPSLGTLFFMAPEQADLNALPDARWDVYALGAILYCLLTGQPPYRTEQSISELETAPNLEERLRRYRKRLEAAPPLAGHLSVPGMDRALAEIIQRCLAVDPERRYPHVVSLLDDLEQRDRQRGQRPLLLLGVLGPLLLLLTMGFFASRAYQRALAESRQLVTAGALSTNRFAAEGEARLVASELEMRFQAAQSVAEDPRLATVITTILDDSQAAELLPILADPRGDPDRMAQAKSRFLVLVTRRPIDDYLHQVLTDVRLPAAASCFVTDRHGTMLGAAFLDRPPHNPIGDNFAYRTYFHGGPVDLATNARPATPLADATLSSLFQSTATGTWKVAISTPVRVDSQTVGVLAITVELGEIFHFTSSEDQSALLIDGRDGESRGLVLAHPLFDQILARAESIPPRFSKYRIDLDRMSSEPTATFSDPFAEDELGSHLAGAWLVSPAQVTLRRPTSDDRERRVDTGLILLVQSRAEAANRAVENLARWLLRDGLGALLGFIAVTLFTWLFVMRMTRTVRRLPRVYTQAPATLSSGSLHTRDTLDQI